MLSWPQWLSSAIEGPPQQIQISVTMFAVGNTNEPIGDSPYAVKCSAP